MFTFMIYGYFLVGLSVLFPPLGGTSIRGGCELVWFMLLSSFRSGFKICDCGGLASGCCKCGIRMSKEEEDGTMDVRRGSFSAHIPK